jgi:ribosome-associated toxin RatA of RatAB toxin-antitoxin module
LQLQQSVLLPYAVNEMFDLIEHAESYPQFVPWCTGVTLLERSEAWVAARLEFSYRRLRFGVHTRNAKCRPERLQLALVDGPFKHFSGEWRLLPLGELGCKVSFDLSFEVAEGIFDEVAAPVAQRVAHKIVQAFVQRAEATLTPLPAPAPPGA